MAVELLIGGLGSGKSTAMLDAMAAESAASPEGAPLILLVPEQASYLAEKRLLARLPSGATQRARVLSFQRLAEWVWSLGPARSRPPLGEIHQFVLVTTLLARRRRDAAADDPWRLPSLARGVAALLAEMKQFRVGPAQLAQWADELAATDADLAARLRLLEDIVGAMGRLVEERFEDPHDSLASVRESLERVEGLQGARVWVDGFHGFTPVEFEVLRGLMRRCARVTIALTLDAQRARHVAAEGFDPDRFSRSLPTEETYVRLRGLVGEERVELLPDVVRDGPPPRYAAAPPLDFLAVHFLADAPRRPTFPADPAPHLALEVAATARDEARRAAEHVVRWHRDQGIPWGRLAIITRDLAPYAEAMAEALALLGVPHYIDRHDPIESHPLIQGCLAAIDIAIVGWHSDAVMAFARAGLYPNHDADDAARLGAFVARYPRNAGAWAGRDAWKAPPARSPFEPGDEDNRDDREEMARVNAIRDRIVAPLRSFVEAAREGRDADGAWRVAPLVQALARLVHDAMPAPGDTAEALLKVFGERLDALVVAAGDDPMDDEVLRDVLRETLGHLPVPGIPPVLDVVIVAQADRSRLPEVEAAVVVGLADGRFPLKSPNHSLLSDRERETLLKSKGGALRASSRHQFLREGYLAHLALGAARRHVVLLRPASGAGGEALAPSPWWIEVRRLFPLATESTVAPLLSRERVARPAEVATLIARAHFDSMRRRPSLYPADLDALWTAAGELTPTATRTEVATVVRRAVDRNEPHASPARLRAFLGARWNTSVSALEAWPACPFRFFLRAAVRPQVATRPELEATDAGNFAHAVLQAFSQRVLSGELALAAVGAAGEATRREWIDEAAAKPLARMNDAGLLNDARGALIAARLKAELAAVIGHWGALAARTGMGLLASESRFGGHGAPLAGLVIAIDESAATPLHVNLRGQIDRIDVFEDGEGGRWVAVADYKLTPKTLNWNEVRDGSQLQLAAYLAVVADNAAALGLADTRTVGAYYMPIHVAANKARQWRGVIASDAWERLNLAAPDKVAAQFGVGTKGAEVATGARGDVIAPRQMAALTGVVRAQIERAVRAFLAGDVAVRPRLVGRQSACTHCDYKPACRIDHALNALRPLAPMGRPEAIDVLLGPPAGGDEPVSPIGDTP